MVPRPGLTVLQGPIRITASSDGLVDELAGLWKRVTDAGGALGYDRGDAPAALRAAAREAVAEVGSPDVYLFVLFDDAGVRAFARFDRAARPIRRHCAELVWIAVHPGLHGFGWGGKLLEHGLGVLAADGVEAVCAWARSGHGLERFYTAHGFAEVGRWPRAVRLHDGSVADGMWLLRDRLRRP